MQRFTGLKVWRERHSLALAAYRLTRSFSSNECYGLVSRLRRAAVSVPTNLAEASLAESEYLLIFRRDVDYVQAAMVAPLFAAIADLARMLHALRKAVERAASPKGRHPSTFNSQPSTRHSSTRSP